MNLSYFILYQYHVDFQSLNVKIRMKFDERNILEVDQYREDAYYFILSHLAGKEK